MSYSQRQRIYPSLGKEAEVRALLTDWVTSLQGRGRNSALLTRLYSSEGSALVVVSRADDLAVIERNRRENVGDSDFQARAAKLMELVRRPVETALFEMTVPVPSGDAAGVVVRAHAYPRPGKDRQVRSIVEELAADGQKAGLRQGAGVAIYSGSGSVVELTSVYPDLAAADRARKERAAISREAAVAVSELSRQPIAQRLFEVLVPFPR